MSNNQSRGERSEFAQYKKSGRSGSSNQQSHYPGGASIKGGGGASSAPLNPGSRSVKKYNNNVQPVQPKGRNPNVDLEPGTNAAHNGSHQQQPTGRLSDAPVPNTSSNAKATDAPAQEGTRAVPRPSPNVSNATPTSNVSSASFDSEGPKTPTKDTSKSFPLQFGSLSPGFMNGVQIPARTSSAPPNLDEQKKAQARQDSLKAAPAAISIPSIPRQHLPKKDTGVVDQTNAAQAQSVSKSKRDTQVSAAQSVTQTQKPTVHPIPGMPMQMPFHQPQVPIQFGGPNPQMQSQALSGTSLPLQMQMSIPMGSPPMQQPMFIPGLQPHPVQSQGMMHQGQNFHFSTQMGHQLPPPLGGMGINMPPPQFSQQQPGKYGASRKSVKITHPETHEELRLDNSPGPRPHPNAPPQSQSISSYPPNHPMNYYANSYGATPPYFPAGSSVSKNSTQVSTPPTAQPPRSYSQVTVKAPISSHGEKKQLPTSASIVEPVRFQGEGSVRHQKEVDHSSLSSLAQSKPSSTSGAPSDVLNVEGDVANASLTVSTPFGVSAAVSTNPAAEARGVVIPDSVEDKDNKVDNRGLQDQVAGQPSFDSQLSEVDESVTAKASLSKESLSTTVPTSETSHSKSGSAEEGTVGDASMLSDSKGVNNFQSEPEIIGGKKQSELLQNRKFDEHSQALPSNCISLGSSEITDKTESFDRVKTGSGSLLEQSEDSLEKSLGSCPCDVKTTDSVVVATHTTVGGNADDSVSVKCLSTKDSMPCILDASLNVADSVGTSEMPVIKPALSDVEAAPVSIPPPLDSVSKSEDESIEKNNDGLISPSLSVKDKISSDATVTKTVVPKGKKKKKEFYRKAEATGTSSDLYNAYKGPEEKKVTSTPAEITEKDSRVVTKQAVEASQENHVAAEKSVLSKVEPDDWEDAAEISPQLESSKKHNQGDDGAELLTKKYSRDFLLKFMEQCNDLPDGFGNPSDTDALMVSGSRDSYPTPGRNMDRPVGGSRPDRRLGGGDDKWNKFPGPLMPVRGDARADVGYQGNMTGFRPGQGGNFGVLRNPRGQAPLPYAGGVFPNLGQSGPQRNNPESDRWQRGTNFQKGLMSSPQTTPPAMHKAEKKYKVGKVTDEEQAKQRQLKAILNKLTPQNFEKLFLQVKQVNIDNDVTLTGVISQIFDKALMEPTFCEMYADFCYHLAADLPELTVENERITFKRLLLNKCQEEFERGEREEEEANKANEEGEVAQSAEEREEKRLQARRRMLGNIRLIGELYKKRMLTERIMHECINKLLGQYEDPDEENIEALCKLMSTIGEMIDHSRAKDHMDAYFDIMGRLSNNTKLSSRVRFMLKDSIDLRKNKWQQRRKVEGPKKIEEVHRDAAQERQAQAGRMSRAPSMGNSNRRGPVMDFAPRASSMLSPGSQMGGFRAASPQMRGYGSQDVRIDERHSFDRTMSVPLLQRPLGDDSITLGPQGGLMSSRGRPLTPNNHLPEMTNSADARRMTPGLNGFSAVPEQIPYGRREDITQRNMPDLHLQERNNTSGNRPASPLGGPSNSTHNISSENAWTEEQWRSKSMATIKEFYSARDEKEVALCIKDLNAPTLHPSMISIWVADSFERKDLERDLLTKLLINLSKPQDGLISKDQLIQGFESVLSILEDAVNDAPKAAEFLGRIFARVILENIIPLSRIGQLIREGGEEPGSLVEGGLAAELLGTIMDVIKTEKGDSVLNEIRASSNVKLENFRPPGWNKPLRIDKFM